MKNFKVIKVTRLNLDILVISYWVYKRNFLFFYKLVSKKFTTFDEAKEYIKVYKKIGKVCVYRE